MSLRGRGRIIAIAFVTGPASCVSASAASPCPQFPRAAVAPAPKPSAVRPPRPRQFGTHGRPFRSAGPRPVALGDQAPIVGAAAAPRHGPSAGSRTLRAGSTIAVQVRVGAAPRGGPLRRRSGTARHAGPWGTTTWSGPAPDGSVVPGRLLKVKRVTESSPSPSRSRGRRYTDAAGGSGVVNRSGSNRLAHRRRLRRQRRLISRRSWPRR
jgi:hypothetical protein